MFEHPCGKCDESGYCVGGCWELELFLEHSTDDEPDMDNCEYNE